MKETPWGPAYSEDDLRKIASNLPKMTSEQALDEFNHLNLEGYQSPEQEERRLAIGQYIRDQFGGFRFGQDEGEFVLA